jgi:hypothetical protein
MTQSPILKVAAISSSLLLFGGYLAYQAGCSLPFITRSPSITATEPSRDAPVSEADPAQVMLSGSKSYIGVVSVPPGNVGSQVTAEPATVPSALLSSSKAAAFVIPPTGSSSQTPPAPVPANSQDSAGTMPAFLMSGSKSTAPLISPRAAVPSGGAAQAPSQLLPSSKYLILQPVDSGSGSKVPTPVTRPATQPDAQSAVPVTTPSRPANQEAAQ